jgi:hypothetical protein
MVFIYILELENNKYYIGKTTNPFFKLEQHFKLNESQWINKYKPIRLHRFISDCDNFDEDKYTLKYMEQYGINNVRGGSFSELKLKKDNLETIKKMIKGSTNKCYICGEHDHFVNNCNQDIELINYNLYHKSDNDTNYEEIDDSNEENIEVRCCSYCNKEFNTIKGVLCHEQLYCKKKLNIINSNNLCIKCGKTDHNINNCHYYHNNIIIYNKEIYNCRYCNKEFFTINDTLYHEKIYCINKKKTLVNNLYCFRCE